MLSGCVRSPLDRRMEAVQLHRRAPTPEARGVGCEDIREISGYPGQLTGRRAVIIHSTGGMTRHPERGHQGGVDGEDRSRADERPSGSRPCCAAPVSQTACLPRCLLAAYRVTSPICCNSVGYDLMQISPWRSVGTSARSCDAVLWVTHPGWRGDEPGLGAVPRFRPGPESLC